MWVLWVSENKQNEFLFCELQEFCLWVFWVSENKQKMSLVSLSFKSSICESCESLKTSKNEFLFLWASRVPFERLVSVTKVEKMSFLSVSFKNYICDSCESPKSTKNELYLICLKSGKSVSLVKLLEWVLLSHVMWP